MNPRNGFRCIVADPPWQPRDKLPGPRRGAVKNYRVMQTEEIAGFLETLNYLVANSAILFLWRLSSMQEDALVVAKAWGFRVMSDSVWDKRTKEGKQWFGMGRTVRASHETALIGVRGSAADVVAGNNVRSLFDAPVPTYWDGHPDIGSVLLDEDGDPAVDKRGRIRRVKVGDYIHSAKPDEFLSKIVDPLVGTCPKLELFARHRRPGWTTHGDQLPPE